MTFQGCSIAFAILIFAQHIPAIAQTIYQPPIELKSLSVQEIDQTLPDVSFEKWLETTVGKDYKVQWKKNPCGRFSGMELKASGLRERICLIANEASAFGREVEIIFEETSSNSKTQKRWRIRRIRFYSDLSNSEWVELQKLSHVPYTLAADRDSRYASGIAWNHVIEDRERSEKLGSQFLSCTFNPDGTTKLMRAARDGDQAVVEELLRKGVDINERSIGCGGNWHEEPMRDKTALMFAAENGRTQIVQKLVSAGADIMLRTNKSMTAWSYAADNYHLDVLKILWKKAGNEIPQWWLVSSSYKVSTSRQPNLIEFLAKRITNPAHLAKALTGAAMMGDAKSVQILLDHGAWVTGPAIAAAAYHGAGDGVEALALLLKHVDTPDLRWMQYGVGTNYVTPLMIVVERVSTDWGFRAIDILLAHGANPNAIDAQGDSVLDYAKRRGGEYLIRKLEKLGAKEGGVLISGLHSR